MNNLLLVMLFVVSILGAFATIRWQADQHVRVAPLSSSALDSALERAQTQRVQSDSAGS